MLLADRLAFGTSDDLGGVDKGVWAGQSIDAMAVGPPSRKLLGFVQTTFSVTHLNSGNCR